MRNRILGILLLVCLFSCNNEKKETITDAYIISGKISGLTKGEMIVCRKILDDVFTDTAFADIDGNFVFKGKVDEPIFASIYLPKTVEETQMAISLFIEPGNTIINTDVNALNKAKIEGGSNNKDLQLINSISDKYESEIKILGDTLRQLYSNGKMEMLPPLEKRYVQLVQKQKEEIGNFIKNNPKSFASAYYAYQLNAETSESEKAIAAFEALDKIVQTSFYAQKLKKIAEVLQATAIGSNAPNFTLNSIENTPVSLSSFKGKYVLIDFWASWCGPCRKENPNVVKAFDQFKNKNFTILGVSLDEDKIAWQSAVIKDKLNWQHVSDLQGWRSSAAALYGVQSIPANFLIDPSGKIIAKDLHGDDLLQTLSSTLK